MTKVLVQKERIPNVPRCVGSAIHQNEGSLGVVVLLAGFSIYVIHQRSVARSKGEHDQPRRGFHKTTTYRESE